MDNMDIARQRLQNQKLLQTTFTKPGDVVAWLGAVQAQDYSGAKWAVAQRASGITDAEMDKALADGTILRTHLLRPTWHFVSPADIRWMLMLTAPRVHAVSAYMHRQLELNRTIINKSYAVLEKALQGGKQLTRTELAGVFEKAGIQAAGLRMSYFMMSAELDGIICSGGRKGKQFTYALLEERVPKIQGLNRNEALAELVKRYFTARGPATLYDFTMWSGLTMADAKMGIDMVKAEVSQEDIGGKIYWFSEFNPLEKLKSPIAHLLPNYDEYFIGFKDRSAIGNRIGSSSLEEAGTALNSHILFVDGQIVGGWRRTLKANETIIEIHLLTRLIKSEEQAITIASQRYSQFLGTPVTMS